MEKFVKNKNLCATLLKLKQLHRISYKKMGDIIGYTDIGMSKALKNNTLSKSQTELIIKVLNLDVSEVDADTSGASNQLSKQIQEASVFVIQNKEAMMENDIFKCFINSIVNELVVEKLTKIKEQF